MTWTKRLLLAQAFEDVGMTALITDLTSDQLTSAVRSLDLMMASWSARGVRCGYPMPDGTDGSDMDAPLILPDSAVAAICLNVAVRLAPRFGKEVALEIKREAMDAYATMAAKVAHPNKMRSPAMIAGAGSKTSAGMTVADPEPLTADPGTLDLY
jgi:hypothetical protein